MGKDTVIFLHHPTRSQNGIGEWISGIERRQVFAQKGDVSSSEFFNASQIGLSPDLRFTVFSGDYEGETVLDHDGQKYSIYRVYRPAQDTVELYCQREAGTAAAEAAAVQSEDQQNEDLG